VTGRFALAARARALLLVALLLALQPAAPLLHAHAAADPRAASSSGVHLPGLEAIDRLAATATLLVRGFPLLEEGELSRRDLPTVIVRFAPWLAPRSPLVSGHARLPGHAGSMFAPRPLALPPPSHGPPAIA
jgi:hypothetical protein